MAIDVYSVVEYLESGEINNIMYTERKKAEDHVKAFNQNSQNPFDTVGLDVLTLEMNETVRGAENGEVTYNADINRVGQFSRRIVGDDL